MHVLKKKNELMLQKKKHIATQVVNYSLNLRM